MDKRSFIRAKQSQLHMDREQQKLQVEALKYESIINTALIQRLSDLLSALKAYAEDTLTRSAAEVAF